MPRSISHFLLPVISFALFLTPPSAQADLVWAQREIHVSATPLQKEIVASFPFENTGAEVVRFKDLRSGCSCVSMTVSTMVVPPGAKGDVTVRFAPEFRIGKQKRPIAVSFDDENETKLSLYLIVDIPEIIRPEPLFLRWTPEDALHPKSVTLVTDENYPIESVSIRSRHHGWATRATPIANSRNYSVEVLPNRTGKPQGQYVEVEARLASGEVKRTQVYVVVR